ncbi:MAG: Ku protein [Candidatus Peribacteraceae bacterium]|jgi:DNA end-binding protein Ku
MRAVWTGTLSFGLVNIPVKLFSASEERGGLTFELLHQKDLSPVRSIRVCAEEDHEVPFGEVVRGYQYRRGKYVVLEEEDFRRVRAVQTRSLSVVGFCDAEEIGPAYYEKPYFLEPERGAERLYALLREALRRSGKAALATFVLRGKEHLAAVMPEGRALMAYQLRFHSELRGTDDLRFPPERAADGEEMEATLQFIGILSDPFRPQDYRDRYTEELRGVLMDKVRGQVPAVQAEELEMTRMKDVLLRLRQSLEQVARRSPKSHARRKGSAARRMQSTIPHEEGARKPKLKRKEQEEHSE